MQKTIAQMRVYFILEDFLASPDEITRLLGIQPTRTHIKGECVGTSSIKRSSNQWVICLPEGAYTSLQVPVDAVLDAAPRSLKSLELLGGPCSAVIHCVVYMTRNKIPELELSHSTIMRMAALRASMSLTLYVMAEEADDAQGSDGQTTGQS